MDEIFNHIFEHVKSLEIIDTHEHLPYKESAREQNTDILKEYLLHYFNRDLISAGLRIAEYNKVIDVDIPIMDRWNLVEPYWEAARHTGYGRSLDISVKELYGVDKICKSTLEYLNEQFQNSLKSEHYKKVLKDKSKIRVSLLDQNLDCDKTFFRSVYRLDTFIYPKTGLDIMGIEKETGLNICSMSDWLVACEMALDRALNSGAVALKCGLAYQRTLKFDRVSIRDAEEGFNSIFKANNYIDRANRVFQTGKNFQDYMMHFILGLANKRNCTYQFHTGLQEGNGNIISNSDPSLLSNLFLEYPNVNFDIFHIGYPYEHVVSALAKNFPNVFIDMCWAHIISPEASVNALSEWLECIPVNKISAFGGDYSIIDAVYGHQHLARVNVSKSLARKVNDGLFDIERAKEISEMLFYKNPINIFKLNGKI